MYSCFFCSQEIIEYPKNYSAIGNPVNYYVCGFCPKVNRSHRSVFSFPYSIQIDDNNKSIIKRSLYFNDIKIWLDIHIKDKYMEIMNEEDNLILNISDTILDINKFSPSELKRKINSWISFL